MLRSHVTATELPFPTVKMEMQEMFLRLGFSLMVAQKLVEDKGIDLDPSKHLR